MSYAVLGQMQAKGLKEYSFSPLIYFSGAEMNDSVAEKYLTHVYVFYIQY